MLMMAKKQKAVLLATMALFGTMAAQAGQITFTITNNSPANGLWIMRPWVGISDGGYVTYDLNGSASSGVKHQAEDGVTGDTTSPNLTGPPNACSGTGYAGNGSDCLYQDFNSYAQSYSQTSIGGPTAPGATISGVLNADPLNPNSAYLSYLVMGIPSNDAFFGTATNHAIQLFDGSGNFLSNDMSGNILLHVIGSELLDAGTEFNNECANSGHDTAFLCQSVNGTSVGTPEGTVQQHGAFGSAIVNGTNTFGTTVNNPNLFTAINDFTLNNGRNNIATITISYQATPEPATFALVGLGLGAFGLARKFRNRAA
jgi:hypothetical protein